MPPAAVMGIVVVGRGRERRDWLFGWIGRREKGNRTESSWRHFSRRKTLEGRENTQIKPVELIRRTGTRGQA